MKTTHLQLENFTNNFRTGGFWNAIRLLMEIGFFLLAFATMAQNPTQTVRGKLYDGVSKSPVIGANIILVSSNPMIGSVSDVDGNFRLNKIPVGRIKLKISLMGYEDLYLNDVVVNAGKEVILDIPMTESLTQLNEVNVTYKRSEDRTVTNNEMASVSARPFNAAETAKYAGSFGDPSRMAANFAGVSGANDARNDIIVRGNSPASLLWRLEGVNIPNPNHFGSIGTSGGPVSMLNNNLLAKSDFLTGAFPGEYANALGSVFDLKLRKGNDEKREFLTQMGFNGLEVGAEGPYSKKSKASYLVNYRYSMFTLMRAIGFEIAGTPNYQDFTFKTDIPIGKKGNLSAWALGGKSNINFFGKDIDTEKPDAYGDENTNARVKYFTGIGAISYEHRFSDKTYGKLTFSGSTTETEFRGDTVIYKAGSKEVLQETANQGNNFCQSKLSLNALIAHKISAKDKISGGIIVDGIQYNLQDQVYYPIARTQRNSKGETTLTQVYGQWKHRFNQRLTLNAGLSYLYFGLNGSQALEPRLGMMYQVDERSSVNLAYGLHSNLQPIQTYFIQSRQADAYILTNKDLDFTRSHHIVLGFDRMLTENLRFKVETYYQSIFDAPVESKPSHYSILTEGTNFAPIDKVNLLNKGTGTNYGLELTLEKYFSKGYYFLATASIFDSKYKGSDGIERNTPYNGHYVLNVLAGKEFRIGNGNIFGINWKMTSAGGKYVTPINFEQSQAEHRMVEDIANAFTNQLDGYFRTDLKISYKINRKRLTHEFSLDLQNLTNRQNVFQQAFNPHTNRIGTSYQQSFLPIPFYRLTF